MQSVMIRNNMGSARKIFRNGPFLNPPFGSGLKTKSKLSLKFSNEALLFLRMRLNENLVYLIP